jgi:hypothetical protein
MNKQRVFKDINEVLKVPDTTEFVNATEMDNATKVINNAITNDTKLSVEELKKLDKHKDPKTWLNAIAQASYAKAVDTLRTKLFPPLKVIVGQVKINVDGTIGDAKTLIGNASNAMKKTQLYKTYSAFIGSFDYYAHDNQGIDAILNGQYQNVLAISTELDKKVNAYPLLENVFVYETKDENTLTRGIYDTLVTAYGKVIAKYDDLQGTAKIDKAGIVKKIFTSNGFSQYEYDEFMNMLTPMDKQLASQASNEHNQITAIIKQINMLLTDANHSALVIVEPIYDSKLTYTKYHEMKNNTYTPLFYDMKVYVPYMEFDNPDMYNLLQNTLAGINNNVYNNNRTLSKYLSDKKILVTYGAIDKRDEIIRDIKAKINMISKINSTAAAQIQIINNPESFDKKTMDELKKIHEKYSKILEIFGLFGKAHDMDPGFIKAINDQNTKMDDLINEVIDFLKEVDKQYGMYDVANSIIITYASTIGDDIHREINMIKPTNNKIITEANKKTISQGCRAVYYTTKMVVQAGIFNPDANTYDAIVDKYIELIAKPGVSTISDYEEITKNISNGRYDEVKFKSSVEKMIAKYTNVDAKITEYMSLCGVVEQNDIGIKNICQSLKETKNMDKSIEVINKSLTNSFTSYYTKLTGAEYPGKNQSLGEIVDTYYGVLNASIQKIVADIINTQFSADEAIVANEKKITDNEKFAEKKTEVDKLIGNQKVKRQAIGVAYAQMTQKIGDFDNAAVVNKDYKFESEDATKIVEIAKKVNYVIKMHTLYLLLADIGKVVSTNKNDININVDQKITELTIKYDKIDQNNQQIDVKRDAINAQTNKKNNITLISVVIACVIITAIFVVISILAMVTFVVLWVVFGLLLYTRMVRHGKNKGYAVFVSAIPITNMVYYLYTLYAWHQ